MPSHDGGVRFYRVLSATIPVIGRCTTQVELDGDQLVFRPDTTSWFEVPLDHAAARCLLDALTGEAPGIVRAQHPQNGATTVTVALHGQAASVRVENASKGTLHVVFDGGRTLREIAEGLTTDGEPTARGGLVWSTSSVQAVLAGQDAARLAEGA